MLTMDSDHKRGPATVNDERGQQSHELEAATGGLGDERVGPPLTAITSSALRYPPNWVQVLAGVQRSPST